MNSLPEIEAAADALPVDQQWELLNYLTAKLGQSAPPRSSGISLHEQMNDVCGIIDSGIPDLASNKLYLKGLGR